uniref:O-fucosyltransferase family protein n=1 Tax=Populus trichocarpa TaxID=3694 RepID=B9IAF3_POPTR
MQTSNPDKEHRQESEVYGGDETLASLKALFPNLHSKEALANKRELAPFSSSSSRMAAPDFIVCDEGDVFFYQQQWKLNMPQILAGQRWLSLFPVANTNY